MNNKKLAVILLSVIVIFSIGVIIGNMSKQNSLAQELCKYAEYDFCKVNSYKIVLKK